MQGGIGRCAGPGLEAVVAEAVSMSIDLPSQTMVIPRGSRVDGVIMYQSTNRSKISHQETADSRVRFVVDRSLDDNKSLLLIGRQNVSQSPEPLLLINLFH